MDFRPFRILLLLACVTRPAAGAGPRCFSALGTFGSGSERAVLERSRELLARCREHEAGIHPNDLSPAIASDPTAQRYIAEIEAVAGRRLAVHASNARNVLGRIRPFDGHIELTDVLARADGKGAEQTLFHELADGAFIARVYERREGNVILKESTERELERFFTAHRAAVEEATFEHFAEDLRREMPHFVLADFRAEWDASAAVRAQATRNYWDIRGKYSVLTFVHEVNTRIAELEFYARVEGRHPEIRTLLQDTLSGTWAHRSNHARMEWTILRNMEEEVERGADSYPIRPALRTLLESEHRHRDLYRRLMGD